MEADRRLLTDAQLKECRDWYEKKRLFVPAWIGLLLRHIDATNEACRCKPR